MYPSVEDSGRIVQRYHAFQIDGEARLLRKIIAIDCMYVISAVRSPGCTSQPLICIGFRGQIPGVRVRVNDAGCRDANMRIDVIAIVEIRLKKGTSKVAGRHDYPGLRIDLVDVVLGCGNEKILNGITQSIDKGLRIDLLGITLIVTGEVRLEEESKLRVPNHCRVHVVIVLIARAGVVATPGDRICAG